MIQMQEIAERLDRLENTLLARMQRIEEVLEGQAKALSGASKKEKNAVRRQQYREAKRRREKGLVSLPEQHVLKFRDVRLKPKVHDWAQVGMRFGRADQPAQFLTWFVHSWNNCTYLKKPITFSGSSFRIWGSHVRFSYGPRDLMGFTERRGALQILRNEAEHDDFQKRPWWDWSYAVFLPVYQEMQSLGFDELPERFKKCMQLMVGGFAGYEVYTDLVWDTNESRENINKMLKRTGVDIQLMLRACYTGLRVRGLVAPVQPPPEQ